MDVDAVEKVRRWNKKDKVFIEVDRPEAIKVYNDYIGSVDKMDFLISLYPMNSRTKRWPTRVIMHLLSLSMVNAWLEYRDREHVRRNKGNEILDLLGFRNVVAQALCKAELNPVRPRGRPSFESLLNYCPVPEKKTKAAVRPVSEVHFDGFDHWPEVVQIKSAQRCKLEGCEKSGRTQCMKCNLFLCLTRDRNCFRDFYKK